MNDDYPDDFVYIDRCALAVRPTWKFAQWIHGLDALPAPDDTEIFIQTVYLVDFIERLDASATADLLEAYYLDIAASEFGAWWTDETDWPPIRSLSEFLQYFECAPTETVIDLVADSEYDDDYEEN